MRERRDALRVSAAGAPRAAPTGSLLELVLEEQATLTAVDRFAQRHDAGLPAAAAPLYEDLLPVGRPEAGEQLAFQVDLDACTGCKACVSACHALNGLDDGETWRRVGLLVGEDAGLGVQRTVTSACHHCEDPGCLAGCPVQAYAKDPVTGIVRHLDDQCIGCQYCTLTCPYDVPRYNERLGIVRKCDMCAGRLEVGEAPACVQGCPNGAISIRIVPVGGETAPPPLLPTAPGELAPSDRTRPTTRYVQGARSTRRGDRREAAAALVPADRASLVPGPAHWPLAVLLLGTQLSVGLLGVALGAWAIGGPAAVGGAWVPLAWIAALAGQAASLTHIGRPLYAFRAVLGLRTSWMSREVVTLTAYAGLLTLYLVGAEIVPRVAPSGIVSRVAPFTGPLALAAFGVGCVGVGAQVMIYAVTGRPAWSPGRTAFRFASGAGLLGAAVALATAPAEVARGGMGLGLAASVVGLAVGLLGVEGRWRRADHVSPIAARARGARLETGRLHRRVAARRALLATGAGALAAACALGLLGAPTAAVTGVAAAGALAGLIAELLGRHLFFVTEVARGMPGV